MSVEGGLKKESTPTPKALELFELTEDQKQEFRERVARWDGRVRIFMHALDQVLDEPEAGRVVQVLGRVAMSTKDTPPVLMFLEEQVVDTFLDMTNKQMHEDQNTIYAVRTLPQWCYPVLPGEDMPSREQMIEKDDISKMYCIRSVMKLIGTLQDLGVTSVLIGGVRLTIDETGNLNECVGLLINQIEAGSGGNIDVKVSLGTAPLNRNDLRGIRDDLL